MGYARRHRRVAMLAYGSLIIATFAQLVVPQLVNVIVDTVVGGIQADSDARAVAPALLGAMIAIVVFSLVRALFAYGQQYNAERISQNIAFDFRNQLFAKIQRLSFSYLDRNQKGVGRWFSRERILANTVFLSLVILNVIFIVVGTFFRGPNWSFVSPF